VTAAQLKKARAALDWSQGRLAEELGVHPMTVSKWERGEQPIPQMAAIAIRCLTEHR
jgi:transcriptional regulator with XRE-family HTH domain